MSTEVIAFVMPKRSSSKDPNVSAFSIMQQATEAEKPDYDPLTDPALIKEFLMQGIKHPAAVMLGRLGGLKGGKARAKSLTKERRAEIAKKAAAARWKK